MAYLYEKILIKGPFKYLKTERFPYPFKYFYS